MQMFDGARWVSDFKQTMAAGARRHSLNRPRHFTGKMAYLIAWASWSHSDQPGGGVAVEVVTRVLVQFAPVCAEPRRVVFEEFGRPLALNLFRLLKIACFVNFSVDAVIAMLAIGNFLSGFFVVRTHNSRFIPLQNLALRK